MYLFSTDLPRAAGAVIIPLYAYTQCTGIYLFSTDLPRAAGAVVISLDACVAGNAYWETTTTFKNTFFN
jgi:hypothetical protein